jgi:putative ABC transport system permease protein
VKAVIFALRSFSRELRSGEVVVLLLSVALAVAALTAVGFLTDRIGKSVARQANEVLAADIRLRSPDPIPAEWRRAAEAHSLMTAETQSFPSVVFAGDESSLTTVKGVSDTYPLRGHVRISDRLFAEQYEVDHIPAPGTIWADGALMARLGISVGDAVSVGEVDLQVSAVLTYRPDQSIGFASLAPSILLNLTDMPRTGLINEGSRVGYALLVAGEEEAVNAFYDSVEEDLPDSVRIRNREDSSDRAGDAADRADRFLSLTAVISVLLSAVAIAMSARRFAHRRMDTVALMKSLGASQRFIITAASVQIVLLGILGIIIGCITGFAAENLITSMLADLFQSDLPPPGLAPIALGSAVALVLLVGFALPALVQLRNTPPLRVLRHDAIPPPPSRLFVAGSSLLAVPCWRLRLCSTALSVMARCCLPCWAACWSFRALSISLGAVWLRSLAALVAVLALPGAMVWLMLPGAGVIVPCRWWHSGSD